jgi:uncharacterized protein YbjT (DUF2867 family)
MAAPILVTDGPGTLGRLVVPRLREAGCEVRVLSRRGRDYQPNRSPERGTMSQDRCA